MNLSDTLTISILGIVIVFIVLILTTILIYSFRLKEILQLKIIKRKQQKELNKKVNSVPGEKIPEEIIAVLTTVLEIEMRIRIPFSAQKFTFKREIGR